MKFRVMGPPQTFRGCGDKIQLFLLKNNISIYCSYPLVFLCDCSDIVHLKKKKGGLVVLNSDMNWIIKDWSHSVTGLHALQRPLQMPWMPRLWMLWPSIGGWE